MNADEPRAKAHLESLISRYRERTRRSLEDDGRVHGTIVQALIANGFDPALHKLFYPLVWSRAGGSRFWDVDDNEYIDLLMGFGVNLFGHNPEFVISAVEAQLKKGMVIGANSDLVSEVASLLIELTGHERVFFSNTGTEAVMSAVRIARAATGRDAILVFQGSYHGHVDALLWRPGQSPKTESFRPGVPAGATADTWFAEYGSDAALELVKKHGDELAAVLVVPVQNGNPGLQPRAFLHELRALTEKSGTALVFDEVVTGFRIHLGGAQAYFGVRADIATYGKVVGGGLPIGVVLGTERFMRAADAGPFSADGEAPRGKTTFIAGTFNKHALSLAAARATLRHLKEAGPSLQTSLNARGTAFAERIEKVIKGPFRVASCGSMIQLRFGPEAFRGLFMYHAALRGLYLRALGPDGYLMNLSTVHDDRDLDKVHATLMDAVAEVRDAGLYPS